MSLPAGTAIGKYIVRRKIAEGGMAEIYLCSSRGPEGFEKEVVIKRVRPALADDPEFVQMFIHEARLASRLSHANVVQIFDFDKHDDTYYLAMEYVRGKSLWELRRRCKERMLAIPPTVVAQIGLEVARGLFYAHRASEKGKSLELVHRDVTPHNVLLSYDGAVKLTDFGIAKAGNRLTASGMLKGKFAYMSPEQSRAEPVDARTDVFALGIILWEMLTGGRLFEGDSDIAVLRAVQQSVIAPPMRLNPEVEPALDAAVMTALNRELSRRFQTAQDFERALGQYLLGAARRMEDTDVGAFLRLAFTDPGSDRDPSFDDTHSRSTPELAPSEVLSVSAAGALALPPAPGGGTRPERAPGGTALLTAAPPAEETESTLVLKERPSAPAPSPRAETGGAGAGPAPGASAAPLAGGLGPTTGAEPAPELRASTSLPEPAELGAALPPAPRAPEDWTAFQRPRRRRMPPVLAGLLGVAALGGAAWFLGLAHPAAAPAPSRAVGADLTSRDIPDAGTVVMPPTIATAAVDAQKADAGASAPHGILQVLIIGGWANVAVEDQRQSGVSGASRDFSLAEGPHHVLISAPGHRTSDQVVQIQAGKQTQLRYLPKHPHR